MDLQALLVKAIKSAIPVDFVKDCILLAEKAKKLGIDGLGRLNIAADHVIEKLPLQLRFVALVFKAAVVGAVKEVVQEVFDEFKNELGL